MNEGRYCISSEEYDRLKKQEEIMDRLWDLELEVNK